MMLRVCLLGLLEAILVFTGPAKAAEQADKYANIHTVAIVSFLGHIPMISSGFYWSGPPDTRVPDDWRIDDFVTGLVAASLKTRFTVIRVPARPDAVKGMGGGMFTSDSAQFHDWLKANPLPQPVDAYVEVVPGDAYIGNADFRGLALLRAGAFGGLVGKTAILIYAAYRVDVYDAKTGSRIASGTAKILNEPLLYSGVTIEDCDDSIWADAPEKLSAEQKRQIDDEFHFIVEESLPQALSGVSLLDSLGDHRPARGSADGVCRPHRG